MLLINLMFISRAMENGCTEQELIMCRRIIEIWYMHLYCQLIRLNVFTIDGSQSVFC